MKKFLSSLAAFAAAATLVTVFRVNDAANGGWNLRLVQRMDDGTLVDDVADHQSLHFPNGVEELNRLAYDRNMDHLRKFVTCYKDTTTCKASSRINQRQ